MTTAAAEGAAIPGAAAKTAPTLDEALNIAGGTLHFEPYMPGEVVCPSGRFKPAANRDMRLMQ